MSVAEARREPPAVWSGGGVEEVLTAVRVETSDALTVPGLLRRSVELFPGRTAIRTPQGARTFDQLEAASAGLAARLRSMGVASGQRVGILLPNGPEFVSALVAVTACGATAVLLNTFATESETRDCLRRSGAAGLLCSTFALSRDLKSWIAQQAPETGVATALDESAGMSGGWMLAIDGIDQFVDMTSDPGATAIHSTARPRPDDPAVIIFTSGSSGVPKSVVHRHKAVCIQAYRYVGLHGLDESDRLLSFSPYFWSSGLVKSMGAALASGATLLAMPRFNASSALAFIEAARATKLISPVHLDHQMVGDQTFAERDLSALRGVHRRSPLVSALGLETAWSPGGYGLSEMCTLVSSFSADTDPELLAGSEGWVVPGVEVKIAAADSHAPVTFGEIGRICVRGDTLMLGYDDVTTTLDPEGYFITSDMGELDADGRLYFRGRSDSVIRSGGTNVSPMEVENALTGWHRLRRSAVVALPHPDRGQVLVLCAVPSAPAVTEQEVLDYLREQLAGYKIPRRVLLISESEVAYTSTHKVDLRATRTWAIRTLIDEGADPAWIRLLEEEGR